MDGTFLSMNRAGLNMMGRSDESQVCGVPYLNSVRDQDKPAIAELLDQAREGRLSTFEFETPNGQAFESCFVPLADTDGKTSRIMGITQDISERRRAERELAQSEQRFRTLAESLPLSIAVGQDGRRVFANRYVEELTGYSLDELVGQQSGTLTHPDHRERMLQQLSDCLEHGVSDRQENKIIRKDGQERWVDFSTTPIDWDGRPATLDAAIDITERKQGEEALRESEERFRRLAENVDAVFWMRSADGKEQLYVSPKYEDIWGRTLQSLREQPDSYINSVHPDDQPALRAAYAQLAAGGRPEDYNLEYRITRPDGEVRRIHDRGFSILGESGALLHQAGFAEDITDRKQAEDDLRESLSRQQLIIKSANIGLWDRNLITDEVFYSPEWKSQLGYADDELPNNFETWHSRLHPDDREQTLAGTQEFLAKRQTHYSGEFRLKHRDGSWRWILALAELQLNATGEPMRMMGCHVDLTDLRQAETDREAVQRELADRLRREREIVQSELDKTREELVLATRLSTLGKIAAQIAHDLRNPLSAIRNAAFYLKGELQDAAPDVREFVGLIDNEVATCDTIIRNLMEAVRPREPDRRPVNVAQVVQSAFQRLHAPDGVELKLHASSDPFYIDFDPVQCRQLMDNLLSNALHAVKGAGRIEVSLECDDEEAVIRIHDSGPGVPTEARDFVFDLLFTTKATGTGLGLVICRQIVEKHGGTISLEVQGTGGASFLIRVPQHA
jgi:PAS domain S-box-containing protein